MVRFTKKYRTFMGGVILYLFLIPAAAFYIRTHPDSVGVIPFALLPVLPIVLTLSTLIRYPDRFARNQRRPLLNAGAFAFLCTLFLTLALGILEILEMPPLPWILIPFFMVIFWSLGMFLAHLRASD